MWYRDENGNHERCVLGQRQNTGEFYVGYNSQGHKEGNTFTMQVNTHPSKKVEGETRGVGSDHRRGETGS